MYFLQVLSLEKYFAVFEEAGVDFDQLVSMTETDLRQIGITLFGPRRKISAAIAQWRDNRSKAAR